MDWKGARDAETMTTATCVPNTFSPCSKSEWYQPSLYTGWWTCHGRRRKCSMVWEWLTTKNLVHSYSQIIQRKYQILLLVTQARRTLPLPLGRHNYVSPISLPYNAYFSENWDPSSTPLQDKASIPSSLDILFYKGWTGEVTIVKILKNKVEPRENVKALPCSTSNQFTHLSSLSQ